MQISERRSLASLMNPATLAIELWRRRDAIGQLARREVQMIYRDSLLGALWTIIQPVVTLIVYAFVFLEIFTPRSTVDLTPKEFVLGMFCGIVIYGIFADTLSRAPLLVLSNTSYVKRIVFPLEILPVSALAATLVNLLAGLVILVIGMLVMGSPIPVTAVLLPVTLVPLILLSLGLSWFLASLGVFLRDVQQAVRVLLQIVFFLTPIVWTMDFLPPRFHLYVMLNPLTTIVESSRAVMIHGTLPDWGALGIVTVISVGTLLTGYAWFMKTRHGFADVL